MSEKDEYNWKPWNKEAYKTIKPGRYRIKLEDGTVTCDDFKNRGPMFGYGFSGYTEKHIVAYAEW